MSETSKPQGAFDEAGRMAAGSHEAASIFSSDVGLAVTTQNMLHAEFQSSAKCRNFHGSKDICNSSMLYLSIINDPQG